MRSSARTPSHSQVSPSPRSPVPPPSSKEDWSRRRFYKTMQHIFRPDRQNQGSLDETPFYLRKKPLSEDEFEACAEHYIMAERKKYHARLVNRQQDRPPQSPNPDRWPDLKNLGLLQDEFWKFEIPLGQLFFAETKQQQKQARQRINVLAQRGPNEVRQAIAKARRSIPQARRTLSGRDRFDLFDYRAKRQFLWIFLRYESEWEKGQKKEGKSFDRTVQELVKAYSYLGLTPATIAEGLRDPHQADKDAAKKFPILKIKASSSVRSLLNRSLLR
jgi:hypothetical protein